MRDILERWKRGPVSRDVERALVRAHVHHFRRRVARLGPSYFPGTEKSDEAVTSLAHGAFASFCEEAFRDGQPAFAYALSGRFRNPLGILYYWRGAATIEFLEREGPPVLRERRNLRRNVLEALKARAPSVIESGEPRFGALQPAGEDPKTLELPKSGWRVPEAIDAVLARSARPLSAEELFEVLERNAAFLEEWPRPPEKVVEAAGASPGVLEGALLERELGLRVERFFEGLDDEERALLARRGYGRGEGRLVSFDAIHRAHPSRSKEWYRARERAVLEAFRDLVDPEEQRSAVEHLQRLVARVPAETSEARR